MFITPFLFCFSYLIFTLFFIFYSSIYHSFPYLLYCTHKPQVLLYYGFLFLSSPLPYTLPRFPTISSSLDPPIPFTYSPRHVRQYFSPSRFFSLFFLHIRAPRDFLLCPGAYCKSLWARVARPSLRVIELFVPGPCEVSGERFAVASLAAWLLTGWRGRREKGNVSKTEEAGTETEKGREG